MTARARVAWLVSRLAYVAHPRFLAAKLLHRWRRGRSARAYREALAAGRLVTGIPSAPRRPTFSVIMPVFRVAQRHLAAAIRSVLDQRDAEVELLLLDDASPDPHVRPLLARAAGDDPRVRAFFPGTNTGIAAASNLLARHARGEYLAFVDHDDTIAPGALDLVGRFLAQRPEVDWLFTDEDKIDEDGRHHEPCFKPGWSHHLLLSFNYVCHLRVVRRAMFERVGGHRDGFDGAQDYDLALRVLAAGGRFAHLPGVLYHWRTVASSMATAAGAKPAAHAHALRALGEHAAAFPRGGAVHAEVLLAPASFFAVRRAIEPGLATTFLVAAGEGTGQQSAGQPAATHVVQRWPPAWDEVERVLRRVDTPLVACLPHPDATSPDLAELAPLLNVPGTAIATARRVRGRRVAASGWATTPDGRVVDPWAGLHLRNPGYLNLAMVPGPRSVPLPLGWVAWRAELLAALGAAAEVEPGWRLAVGLARADLAAVVTPSVSLAAQAETPWPGPRPPGVLPHTWSGWTEEFRLNRH